MGWETKSEIAGDPLYICPRSPVTHQSPIQPVLQEVRSPINPFSSLEHVKPSDRVALEVHGARAEVVIEQVVKSSR